MRKIGAVELEALKHGVDLVKLVESYGVRLKRTGKLSTGLCPFHDDKNPSFAVDPGRNTWKCFGACATNGRSSGDAIAFVMRKEGLSFPEAMDKLFPELKSGNGRRSDEALATVAPPAAPEIADTERARVLDLVVKRYERSLANSSKAQRYLQRRGLMVPALVHELRVGYADGFITQALAPDGDMRKKLTTLGILNERGQDKLSGTIVVPLLDPKTGAVMSLYGRALIGRRHHYLDGPLRGLVNARPAMSSEELVIVESVLDAMSLMAMGIRGVLPIYGTNGWTKDHDQILDAGAVKRLVLLLDSDKAGQQAARTLGEKLARRGREVRIATLPDHKDPNEALVAGVTRDQLVKVLAQAELVTPPAEASANVKVGPWPQDAAAAVAPPSDEARSFAIEDIEGGILLTLGPRRYRVRGITGSGFDRLFVNLRLEDAYGSYTDRLDLYSGKARRSFARRVGADMSLDEAKVEQELNHVILTAEAFRDKKTKAEEASSRPAPPELTEAERNEAVDFLRSPKLLETTVEHMGRIGYVGEETNKALGYLIIVSRKLSDPLSALILSQSGAGKSGLTEVLEKLTAPEDVVLFSRLTPAALYYMDQDFLQRKVVIIEERSGSEEADYSVRTLQSRKKLVLGVPMKNPKTGKTRTQVIEVLGPSVFIETSTAMAVNHENSTRCFEIYLDESEAQTHRIHGQQRRSKTLAGQRDAEDNERLVKLHWNAQRVLKPVKVDIPFVDDITFPAHWLRTRRDHFRFLNLIEASAFLHQYQRPAAKGSEPGTAIEATVSDYRIAYELARDVLGSTLSDVKKPTRELLDAMRVLTAELGRAKKIPPERVTLTRREVRESVGLPNHQVRRLLKELVELEHVEVVGGRKGQLFSYRLVDHGEPGAGALKGLLTPEDLVKRLGKRA